MRPRGGSWFSLTFSARSPLVQCRQDRDRGVQSCEDIGDRDAHLHRLAAGRTGDAHQPTHRLHEKVVTQFVLVWPGLAEARDRAIDQARVDGRKSVIVEPESLQSADLEVLDDDVAGLCKRYDDFSSLAFAEIHRHRFLPTVGGEIISAEQVRFMLTDDEGWAPAPRVISLPGPLNLDDFGTEVRQQLRRPRTSQDPAEIENMQSAQACSHDRLTRTPGCQLVARLGISA